MHKITKPLSASFKGPWYKSFKNKRKSPNHPLLSKRGYREKAETRNQALNNSYAGETAYIISCGPSIDQIWNDQLKQFLSDKLVIGIKQSLKLDPSLFDYHLYNEVRMESDYLYHNDTIRLSVSEFQENYPPHIHYPIHSYKWEDSVFVTEKFDDWSLSNSYVRPWGIGIMFELGLFLPVFLGCKKIVIMGFDMNPSGKFHYYDNSNSEDSNHYNVNKDEFKFVSGGAKAWHQWVNALNIDARLYSPLSGLPIPKLHTLEEVMSFHE